MKQMKTYLFLVVLIAAGPAFATDQAIPDTFGNLKLRMPLADAVKAAPDMKLEEASAATNKGVEPPFAFAVGRFTSFPLGPLSCAATAMFFQKQLIQIQYVCPDGAALKAYLTKTYAKPEVEADDGNVWKRGDRSISYNPGTPTNVSVFDNVGNSNFQSALLFFAMSQQTPNAAPPPAATPAKK